jgi:hypothetical protein
LYLLLLLIREQMPAARWPTYAPCLQRFPSLLQVQLPRTVGSMSAHTAEFSGVLQANAPLSASHYLLAPLDKRFFSKAS